MTQVSPISNVSPSLPTERREPAAPVAPVTPAAGSSNDPAPADHRPKPLTVDIDREGSGVFVYTLRDPSTDTVIAVIPRADVRPDRDGRHLDQRV